MSGTMGKANRPKALWSVSKSKQAKLPPLPEPKKMLPKSFSQPEPEPEEEKPVEYETLSDPFDFIRIARERGDIKEFVYLSPIDIIEDAENPTRLRIIPSAQASREEFWNLSLEGLTHVREAVVDFIPLDEWEKDNRCFSKLMSVPFFGQQRQWRMFRLWKKAVQCAKMRYANEALTSELFFSHSVLRPAFIKIQRELNQLQQMKLFAMHPDGMYTLTSFTQNNAQHRDKISKIFEEMFDRILTIVQNACQMTMDKLNAGEADHLSRPDKEDLSPLDRLLVQYEKTKRHETGGAYDSDPSLLYTKKAARRAVCQKLVRFIRLVDYVVISALRHLCFSSLMDMFSITQILHKRGVNRYGFEDPEPLDELVLPVEYQRIYQITMQKTAEVYELPIFRIDVSYSAQLNWTPTENSVIDVINAVRNEFIDILFKVPRLVVNPSFKQYVVDDVAADKGQDRMSAPDLGQIVFKDPVYKETSRKQSMLVSRAFALLDFYGLEFQKAIDMYEENNRFNVDFMRVPTVTAVDIKEKMNEMKEQEAFIRTAVDKSEVGVFGTFTGPMKQLFLKSPVRCLGEIRQEVPNVTQRFLTEFTNCVQNAYDELTITTDDVTTFVEYICAVEKHSTAMTHIQQVAEAIRGFHSLAQDNGIYIPPEDQSNFHDLMPLFEEVKRCLAFAGEQKQNLMPKFSTMLDKNIAQLRTHVIEVTEMAKNTMFGDMETTVKDAAAKLVVLTAKTDEIECQASSYNGYEKAMCRQVTKFEDVKALVEDVRVKKLLWETKTGWEFATGRWFQMPFNSINPATMVDQLEEFKTMSLEAAVGLPTNEVADELRAEIADFSNLLPIVTNLKNPALRQQHIDQIVNLIGGDIFGDVEFRFGKLVDLHAFNYVEQISAISAQATNEQTLYDMLASVRGVMNEVQFDVVSCKFQKNTYTLNGAQSILARLGDAQTVINSVLCSKWVAQLRAAADESIRPLRSMVALVTALDKCQNLWAYLNGVFTSGDVARQLQSDSKDIQSVDKTWRVISTKMNDQPSVAKFAAGNLVLPDLENAIVLLEKVKRSVNDFLDSKRAAFPRLFFLSNDEMMDLLSRSKEPTAINPYLPKLFDGIHTLELGMENHSPVVIGIASIEGERIALRPVKFRNNVETWLSNFEEMVQRTIKAEIKAARAKYSEMVREDWIQVTPMQYVLTVAQMEWSARIEEAFQASNPTPVLTELVHDLDQKIGNIVKTTQLDLRGVERAKMSSVLVLDSHIRTIVKRLIDENIECADSYVWTQQLVYRWDESAKEINVSQMGEVYKYGYEYTGCYQRLVLTPQLLRTFENLSVTYAKHMGGCAYGPAGCGKTQSIVDMGRALAIYTVVFNCSDLISSAQVSSFFRGVVQAGVWGCLQEVHNLSQSVVAVVAEHMLSLQRASVSGQKKFMFDGVEIPHNVLACLFGTVSVPKNSGETIPDSMKACFRPITFCSLEEEAIINMTMISLGFKEPRAIAKKLAVFMKTLELMLAEDSYGKIGLGKMKRVLVQAAALRRSYIDVELSDEALICKAIEWVVAPFLKGYELRLTMSIITDVFGTTEVPPTLENEVFSATLNDVCEKMGLERLPLMLTKITQLHEVSRTQQGVILVGGMGTGKTTALEVLAAVYGAMCQGSDDIMSVNRHVICPKVLTLGELFGMTTVETGEWIPGIIETTLTAIVAETRKESWIVFDGALDTDWINNMNTSLDDNQIIILANGKRTKIPPNMRIFFEVPELATASPTTVTRSCVICFDSTEAMYLPYLRRECESRLYPLFRSANKEVMKQKFIELMENNVQPGIDFLKENAGTDYSWTHMSCIDSLITIFMCVTDDGLVDGMDLAVVTGMFTFAFVWAFGGHLRQTKRVMFDGLIRDLFGSNNVPAKGIIFDWIYSKEESKWVHWSTKMPEFPDTVPDDFEIRSGSAVMNTVVVPTVDIWRTSFIMKMLLRAKRNVILKGEAACGKTLVCRAALEEIEQNVEFSSLPVVFNAATTAQSAQEAIQRGLEVRQGLYMRPLCNKSCVICVDNLNSPVPDKRGSRSAIELLRQILGLKGVNVRPNLNWMEVKQLTMLGMATYNPESDHVLPNRLLRYVSVIDLPTPDNTVMYGIINSILRLYYRKYNDDVKGAVANIAGGVVSFYESVIPVFTRSEANPTYAFSMKDVSQVIAGLLSGSKETLTDAPVFEKLWSYEVLRTFGDRINGSANHKRFEEMLVSNLKKKMSSEIPNAAIFNTVFSDVTNEEVQDMDGDEVPNRYAMYDDIQGVIPRLEEYAGEFSYNSRNQNHQILLFDFFVEHLLRAMRVLKRVRANMMLIGGPGTGKRTVARFAAFIGKAELVEISSTNYMEELKATFMKVGVMGKNTVILVGDDPLRDKLFVRGVLAFVQKADITMFYSQDDIERIHSELVGYAKGVGENESNPNLVRLFRERVFDNTRFVFAITPSEYNMRSVLWDFPCLVRACTVDLFKKWPDTVIAAIADTHLTKRGWDDERRGKMKELAVFVHRSVLDTATMMSAELGRSYHITPALFISFMECYDRLLVQKQEENTKRIGTLSIVLEKVKVTDMSTGEISGELKDVEPELKAKGKQADGLTSEIMENQLAYDALKDGLMALEDSVKKQTDEITKLKKSVQRELQEVLPPLEQAVTHLKSLNRADLVDLRNFREPPPAVKTVMEVICILAETETNWKASMNLLGDPLFVNKITSKYTEGRHVSQVALKKVQAYVDSNPNFQEGEVAAVSIAAKNLCVWATSLYNYESVCLKVGPAQKQAKALKVATKESREKIKKKNSQGEALADHLEELKMSLDRLNRDRRRLEDSLSESQARVTQAKKLHDILSIDMERWEKQMNTLTEEQVYTEGNSFLCAAFLTYFGPIPYRFREALMKAVMDKCQECDMKVTPNFSIASIMTDATLLREWQNSGLPKDAMSIENAIIFRESLKAPLIMDPHGTASDFIKSFEKSRQLALLKPSFANFSKTIEHSLRLGIPVLVEDALTTIEPSIEGIVSHNFVKQEDKTIVKVHDRTVEVDDKFKLYMTTRSAAPLYTPDVYVKAAVVDFALTHGAFVAQEVMHLVSVDNPVLEAKGTETATKIVADQLSVRQIDERVLELLRVSSENILDDEVLLNTIENSAQKRTEINERLCTLGIDSDKYARERNAYTPLAERISILFFAAAEMEKISPLYVFTRDFFCQIVERNLKAFEETEDRIPKLIGRMTFAIYEDVASCMMEKDRIILALVFAVAMLKADKKIGDPEWSSFVKGIPMTIAQGENPLPGKIPMLIWDQLDSISRNVRQLQSVPNRVMANVDAFEEFLMDSNAPLPEAITGRLDDFYKILIVKQIMPAKLPELAKNFICTKLGPEFLKRVSYDMSVAFDNSTSYRPVLIIADDNSDIDATILDFAATREMTGKVKIRAIAPGDTAKCEKELYSASTRGEWVLIKDISNVEEWARDLEGLISKVCSGAIHPDFRIILSISPNAVMPPNLAKNCSKVSLSKAYGVRRMTRAMLRKLGDEYFNGETACRLTLSVALFHALLSERHMFGRIGLKSRVTFTHVEFMMAARFIKPFLAGEAEDVPYDQIQHTIASLIYGNKVSENVDRELIRVLISRFVSKTDENQEETGIFTVPVLASRSEVEEFVKSIPTDEEPAMFGLHGNVASRVAKRVSARIASALGSCFKAVDDAPATVSRVTTIIKAFTTQLPEVDDIGSKENADHTMLSDPLTLVLATEVELLKDLLLIIRTSLAQLDKAIRGSGSYTNELMSIQRAILADSVPETWKRYDSALQLTQWFDDLGKRVNFFNQWVRRGRPVSFLLHAFSDPKAFLSAICHKHAKTNGLPLATMQFDSAFVMEEPTAQPDTGCYIHGLAFDGARWNPDTEEICDLEGTEDVAEAPWIHLIPTVESECVGAQYYQCPVLRVVHSDTAEGKAPYTKEVATIPVNTTKSPDFWVIRGASLLLSTE